MKKSALAWLGAGLVLVGLSSRAPSPRARAGDPHPLMLRPGVARTISKSQFPLLLDFYWLRTLNLIGEAESAEKNRALYDFGRFLTDSDPRFWHAYKYVGLNVPFLKGRTYVNGDLASDLLRRGTVQFPSDLKLHLFLGFNLFYIEQKYVEASEVFRHGATLEAAPMWMAPLATRLLSHGGKPEEALALAREMYEETTDEALKKELEQRMIDLQVEVDLQGVDAAIAAYRQRFGVPPFDLAALQKEGLYTGPSTDSIGGTISIGDGGKAMSSSLERRLTLYGSGDSD
ncbi:MAG: hypothetical protein JNM17_10775 [Archangium sp.]|nr:hypothetical protein [Archangium sp.]